MQNSTQRGVSLVELMIVLAILGILNALALQASLQYVERARSVMAAVVEQANHLYAEMAAPQECPYSSSGSDGRSCP